MSLFFWGGGDTWCDKFVLSKIWRSGYMPQENSHIQMPRLILKNFHNEKQEFYYFDFLEQKIKEDELRHFMLSKDTILSM